MEIRLPIGSCLADGNQKAAGWVARDEMTERLEKSGQLLRAQNQSAAGDY
jgi:hypothetical protein